MGVSSCKDQGSHISYRADSIQRLPLKWTICKHMLRSRYVGSLFSPRRIKNRRRYYPHTLSVTHVADIKGSHTFHSATGGVCRPVPSFVRTSENRSEKVIILPYRPRVWIRFYFQTAPSLPSPSRSLPGLGGRTFCSLKINLCFQKETGAGSSLYHEVVCGDFFFFF